MTLEQSRKRLTQQVIRSLRESDGYCVAENDTRLNNANRRVIAAMAKAHGEAWLGKVNLYGDERHGGDPILVKWDGSEVYNFGCAFVAPCYDTVLVELIRQRDDAEYTGTAEDAKRVDAIYTRIAEIGGISLVWS